MSAPSPARSDPALRPVAPDTGNAAADDADAPVPDGAQERALDFVHSGALQHVVLADRKAGILFTLLSAALLYLFTHTPPAVWPPGTTAGLWLAVVLLLVAATTLAFLVILPRVRAPGAPGVLFWGAIARHESPEAYLSAICARTPEQLARGKAVYCHQLAQICAYKFRLMRWALLCAGAGLVLFLVALGLGLAGDAPLPPGG
jgi:hypothetical protein